MAVPNDVKQWTEEFPSPLSVWTINHNLGIKPIVQVLIDDGNVNYEYIRGIAKTTVSTTQIVISFGSYTATGRVTYG